MTKTKTKTKTKTTKGRHKKKSIFFLGKSPKLWVGGGKSPKLVKTFAVDISAM